MNGLRTPNEDFIQLPHNMDTHIEISTEKNNYDGNGWSKYQIMVLQQLDDHNKVLQNLNKEIVDLKQNVAVAEAELKMWRAQTTTTVEQLAQDVDEILYDETGLSYKIRDLQKHHEVEEKTNLKLKAMWAIIGAIVVFLINAGAKFLEFFWK
jgi:HrpA-like RNA helicase